MVWTFEQNFICGDQCLDRPHLDWNFVAFILLNEQTDVDVLIKILLFLKLFRVLMIVLLSMTR